MSKSANILMVSIFAIIMMTTFSSCDKKTQKTTDTPAVKIYLVEQSIETMDNDAICSFNVIQTVGAKSILETEGKKYEISTVVGKTDAWLIKIRTSNDSMTVIRYKQYLVVPEQYEVFPSIDHVEMVIGEQLKRLGSPIKQVASFTNNQSEEFQKVLKVLEADTVWQKNSRTINRVR